MSEVKVDTYKLIGYAQRLSRVNSRIAALDRRMDSLYWRVGLLGLWNLIVADSLTGYSWRLNRCKAYLEQTAQDYDAIESYLCSSDPLNFRENISGNFSFGNHKDSRYRSGSFEDFVGNLLSRFLGITGSFGMGIVNEDNCKELVNSVLKTESGFSKLISKVFKDSDSADEFKLSSSLLSYLSGLYTFYTTDYADSGDIISGIMKFSDKSSSAFSGFYDYLEGKLKPREASRFGKKYYKKVKTISVIGSFMGFTADNIDGAKVWFDENSTGYDKIHATIKSLDSGVDLSDSIVELKYGQKVLGRNIHAKYQHKTPVKNSKVIGKANTVFSLVNVFLGTVDGAVEEHEKVAADGVVDSKDHGKIGVHGSVKGLCKIVDCATFGISDAMGLSDNAGKISNEITNYAETAGVDYVKSHTVSSYYADKAQGLIDYANDESNPFLFRVAAEGTAGFGMINAMTIDGLGDCCKWIGNGISKGWDRFTGLFD